MRSSVSSLGFGESLYRSRRTVSNGTPDLSASPLISPAVMPASFARRSAALGGFVAMPDCIACDTDAQAWLVHHMTRSAVDMLCMM